MNPSQADAAVVTRIAVSLLLPAALFVCAQFLPGPPAPLHVYPVGPKTAAHERCPTPTLSSDPAICAPSQLSACVGGVAYLCHFGRSGQVDPTRFRFRFTNPSADPACAVRALVAPSGAASMRHEPAALIASNLLSADACVPAGGATECSFTAHPWRGWHVALVRQPADGGPPELAAAMHLAALRVDGMGARPGKFAIAAAVALAALSLFLLYARRPAGSGHSMSGAALDGALGGALGGLMVALIPQEAGGLGLAMPASLFWPLSLMLAAALLGAGVSRTVRRRPASLPSGVTLVCLVFVTLYAGATSAAELRDLNHWPATRLHIAYIAYGFSAAVAPLLLVGKAPADISRARTPWTPGRPLSLAIGALVLCAFVGSAVSDLVEAASPIPDIQGLGPPLEAFVQAAALAFVAAGISLAITRQPSPHAAWDGLALGATTTSAATQTLRTPLLLVEDAERLQVGELTLSITAEPSAHGSRRHYEVSRGAQACQGELRAGVISTLEAALRRPEAARFASCHLRIRVDFDYEPASDIAIHGRSYQLPLALAALQLAARVGEPQTERETPWMASGCLDRDAEAVLPVQGLAIKAAALLPGGILLCPVGSDGGFHGRREGSRGTTVERLSSESDLRRLRAELARPRRFERGIIVQVATVSLALALVEVEWPAGLSEPAATTAAAAIEGTRHVS